MVEDDDSFFKKETWFHVVLSVLSMWFLWYLVPGVSWASSLGVYIRHPVIKINLWLHDYMLLFEKKKVFCPAFLPSCKQKKKTKHPGASVGQHFCPPPLCAAIMPSIRDQGPRSTEQSAFPSSWFLGTAFSYPGCVCVWAKINTVGFCFCFHLSWRVTF